jgi:hypothetical protein
MGAGGFRSLIILLILTIRPPFAENRWSILNNFFSRRCFFIHACLWPASGPPLSPSLKIGYLLKPGAG